MGNAILNGLFAGFASLPVFFVASWTMNPPTGGGTTGVSVFLALGVAVGTGALASVLTWAKRRWWWALAVPMVLGVALRLALH